MTVKNDITAFTRKIQKVFKRLSDNKAMRALGIEAVEMIRKRTRLGYGVSEAGGKRSKLTPLSSRYIDYRKDNKSSLFNLTSIKRSNLTFSGEMLSSLRVIKASSGKVIVGPSKKRNIELTEKHSSGSGVPVRRYNHLSDLEIKKLFKFYRLNFGDLLKRNKI